MNKDRAIHFSKSSTVLGGFLGCIEISALALCFVVALLHT